MRRAAPADGDDECDRNEAGGLHVDERAQRPERSSLQWPEEIRETPGQACAEGEEDRHRRKLLVGYRPRRGDSVELVRVVKDGSLGGASGAEVVVSADRVKQLRACFRVE